MRGLDEIWQVIFAICGNLHQSSGSLPNLSRNLKRVLRKKRTKTVLSIFPIWNITVCSYSLRIITRKRNYNHGVLRDNFKSSLAKFLSTNIKIQTEFKKRFFP